MHRFGWFPRPSVARVSREAGPVAARDLAPSADLAPRRSVATLSRRGLASLASLVGAGRSSRPQPGIDLNLAENEIGFATDRIGFPALASCMAVVLQTEHGLFGWHVYGLGNIEQRAPRLRDFIASHPPGGFQRLYGVCHRESRHGGDGAAWRAEMDAVAAGLGFNGPVVGFDLGRGTGIGTGEAAYLEVRRDASGACRLGYKRWGKVVAREAVAHGGAVDIRRIVPRPGAYAVEATYKDRTIPGVSVRPTFLNRGRLHAVPESALDHHIVTTP